MQPRLFNLGTGLECSVATAARKAIGSPTCGVRPSQETCSKISRGNHEYLIVYNVQCNFRGLCLFIKYLGTHDGLLILSEVGFWAPTWGLGEGGTGQDYCIIVEVGKGAGEPTHLS